MLGGLLVVALPWWRPSDPLTGRAGLLSYAPSGLAIVLRQAAPPGARVVVPQTWGSWFEWAVPDVQYFVDLRFELYPAEVWADEAAIASGGEAAADALARRQAEILVMPISASDPPPGWVELYRNDDGCCSTGASDSRRATAGGHLAHGSRGTSSQCWYLRAGCLRAPPCYRRCPGGFST